jgi:hypothetical protein
MDPARRCGEADVVEADPCEPVRREVELRLVARGVERRAVAALLQDLRQAMQARVGDVDELLGPHHRNERAQRRKVPAAALHRVAVEVIEAESFAALLVEDRRERPSVGTRLADIAPAPGLEEHDDHVRTRRIAARKDPAASARNRLAHERIRRAVDGRRGGAHLGVKAECRDREARERLVRAHARRGHADEHEKTETDGEAA